MKKIKTIFRMLIHRTLFWRSLQLINGSNIEKKINNDVRKEFEDLYQNEKPLMHFNKKEHIVVSLTTIPSRIYSVKYVVTRIVEQTQKVDKIVLYLDETKRDIFEASGEIEILIRLGVEVKFVDDIGPHTKYFYALQEYDNDIVITVDDDVIYPYKLVETLFNSYMKYPNCISANIVVNYTQDIKGQIESSKKWSQKVFNGLGNHKSIAYGVGGVLYPPSLMPKETFSKLNIKKYSFYADDLWLKAIQEKNKIQVVKAKNGDTIFKHFVMVNESQKKALSQINDKEDRNLEYLKKLLDFIK